MRTQSDGKEVRYLKDNGGRWFYRRRVPQRHQKTLGLTTWNQPCGDVSYQKAVSLVTGWAEEHDALIKALDNPEIAQKVRQTTEARAMSPAVEGLIKAQEAGALPVGFDPLAAAVAGLKAADENPAFDIQDRLIRYRAILEASFGSHVAVPTNADERDEFDLVKRKLERRIAEIAGDPNTISAVSEAYYETAGVTIQVRNKYRRIIRTLINHVGDIPLPHLSSSKLREFREVQAAKMQPSSLASLFTPIRGMFTHAVENEIIEMNPMSSVKMRKEKRSIQMRKWKPFTPEEAQRIFQTMEEVWGSPVRGLSEKRRVAIYMAVRVQAFTAMRPKEVLTLRPENVNEKWIKVIGSKTEGSDRTIPLHHAIADFPAFFHAGGFDTFKSQKKDVVQAVRREFKKLICKRMDPPITEKKKVLYSWRTTFSNAMRRAGADAEMRRAILGHAEAGALKHYDDGPEFAKKRKWVRASDPRTIYDDPGEDDDLD